MARRTGSPDSLRTASGHWPEWGREKIAAADTATLETCGLQLPEATSWEEVLK